ncbi:MAG: hypothetical protein AAFQ37_09285, partial [Bacteroidota bacterium]
MAFVQIRSFANMQLHWRDKSFEFQRYPPTQNRSLRAVNAADVLLLDYIEAKLEATQQGRGVSQIVLCHDRFGVLATCLANYAPIFVTAFRSQEKALDTPLRSKDFSSAFS